MGIFIVLLVMFQARLILSQCPEDCRCSKQVFVDVDCSGLSLDSIPTEDFDDKVIILDLTYNKITYLDDNVLDNLDVPLLRFLNLKHNRVEGIARRALYGVPALYILDLSWNRIQFVEPEVFNFVPELEFLILSYNPEMKLPDNVQSYDLENLKALYMDHCQLETIPGNFFSRMPKLEHLNLAYNNIKVLPSNVFMNTDNLLRLILKHNLFETLNDTVLFPVAKLKVFETQGNPWNCDCNMFSLVMLCSRRHLSVNITCSLLPGGFHSDLYSMFQRNCSKTPQTLNTSSPESSIMVIDLAAGDGYNNRASPGRVGSDSNGLRESTVMSLNYVVQMNVIMILAILMTTVLCVCVFITKYVMLYMNNKYNGEYVLV